MEKSFYFANCIYLLYVIFYYVILEISGEANPSNLPLKLFSLAVAVASVSMVSMALGPPTTSMGTVGMVSLIILTSLHPGSEMHGMPASLTTATCLLSSIFLIISNILVYEQVLSGTSNPRPFFILVFAICNQICLQSDISIPQSQSNFYLLLLYRNYYVLFMIFLARYFRQSILNFRYYYIVSFDRNFLRCLSLMFAYQQNWCFFYVQSVGIYYYYYLYSLRTRFDIPIVPNFYYTFCCIFLLRIRVYSCPATLLSQHPIKSALNKHFSILGVRSDKFPMGVATILSLPLGLGTLISLNTLNLQQFTALMNGLAVSSYRWVMIIIIKYGIYQECSNIFRLIINHFLNRLFNFQRADCSLGAQGFD